MRYMIFDQSFNVVNLWFDFSTHNELSFLYSFLLVKGIKSVELKLS